jgi:type IV secretory pathway VirB6-like protein
VRAVKPYYVSGYKKRVFDRFSKVINTIFSYKTKGNYKILPFLPVVLFVLYPFFFNFNIVEIVTGLEGTIIQNPYSRIALITAVLVLILPIAVIHSVINNAA